MIKERFELAILRNEKTNDHLAWVEACSKYSDRVSFKVINITSENWLDEIQNKKFDFFLTRPPGYVDYYKRLYDERIYVVSEILKLPVYPTLNEILIYENKRMLSYFLDARKIPHPETWVFYDMDEAIGFAEKCDVPLVAKTSIGGGGSGVRILRDRAEIIGYINKSFSSKGITRSFLPNIRKGNYLERMAKRLADPGKSIEYFREKKNNAIIDPQKWFVIFQEYIKTDYEWRCVVVGDSYFGHKKLRNIGEKISGTSKVSWDYPSEELLDFLKEIVVENNFWSQAIDIFFNDERGYLVNELQCFWGSKSPHQMIIDGRPGRFVHRDDNWHFEGGIFNSNNSYDLRMEHILKILERRI